MLNGDRVWRISAFKMIEMLKVSSCKHISKAWNFFFCRFFCKTHTCHFNIMRIYCVSLRKYMIFGFYFIRNFFSLAIWSILCCVYIRSNVLICLNNEWTVSILAFFFSSCKSHIYAKNQNQNAVSISLIKRIQRFYSVAIQYKMNGHRKKYHKNII